MMAAIKLFFMGSSSIPVKVKRKYYQDQDHATRTSSYSPVGPIVFLPAEDLLWRGNRIAA